MVERMKNGPREQKRCILFNLWRFYSKQKEVISVYLDYLDHEDPELRFDALVLLRSVAETDDYVPAYRKCLRDTNPRIRALALKELHKASKDKLLGLEKELEAMLSDPDMEVKQATVKILTKLKIKSTTQARKRRSPDL